MYLKLKPARSSTKRSTYYKVSKERSDQRMAIKTLPDCKWHSDCKMWSVSDSTDNRAAIRRVHLMRPPAFEARQHNGIPVSLPVNPYPDILRPDNVIGVNHCPGNQDLLSLYLPGVLVPQHLSHTRAALESGAKDLGCSIHQTDTPIPRKTF